MGEPFGFGWLGAGKGSLTRLQIRMMPSDTKPNQSSLIKSSRVCIKVVLNYCYTYFYNLSSALFKAQSNSLGYYRSMVGLSECHVLDIYITVGASESHFILVVQARTVDIGLFLFFLFNEV